jgi:hypothetical protein
MNNSYKEKLLNHIEILFEDNKLEYNTYIDLCEFVNELK